MNNYEYLSVKQLMGDHRYPFTYGQLRNFLNFRHRNGLEKAIRKVGKCVYVRRDLFEQWIEDQARGES